MSAQEISADEAHALLEHTAAGNVDNGIWIEFTSRSATLQAATAAVNKASVCRLAERNGNFTLELRRPGHGWSFFSVRKES